MLEILKQPVMGLTKRVLNRDISGNTRLAVKNSIFSFSTTIISKLGSIIFTIILARLLLPELFGLYSLALSTILLFAAFADLGVSQTLIKFVSASDNPVKSKSYFSYLIKIKLILILTSITFLIVLSKVIANVYFNKPIFLALIAGSLYILSSGFIGIFEGLFQASNNFKKSLYKESLFQFSRLILVPAAIIYLIGAVSTEVLLFWIMFFLSICFVFSLIFMFFNAKKEILFLGTKSNKLSLNEKKSLNKFILALSAMTLSGMLFGFVDMFILGRYVEAEFIGFYRAAFSLITSATPLITFSGALFPIFSRLKGKQLLRGLNKSQMITILIAIPGFILTLIISSLVIKVIFGESYMASVNILRLFSFLIFLLPLISIHSSFLVSQNKPKKVLECLILATIVNVVLNYIFIFSLLPYGSLYAVYGATLATIFSNVVYLVGLIYRAK